jgi:molybdopterin synthase catalytic subunit
MALVDVTTEPLDLAVLVAAVSDARCGAVVGFLGIVRGTADDGRSVTGLTYEAYRAMALPELTRIAAEARAQFDGARVAIAHRTGTLQVGEPSVAVAAAAPHRAAAFDACEYAIDELKRRVPIWKKEHYADGAAEWRDNACEAGP